MTISQLELQPVIPAMYDITIRTVYAFISGTKTVTWWNHIFEIHPLSPLTSKPLKPLLPSIYQPHFSLTEGDKCSMLPIQMIFKLCSFE